jgi:hypothetical protein
MMDEKQEDLCEECGELCWVEDLLVLEYAMQARLVCGTCYDKYIDEDGRRKPYEEEE